ncbi:hypothetical protein JKP88DRAFT_292123 [Tribonema minus]|uniref:Uncharacterized protein n=1 Tax=Tribonema minus TaxID=303371 RepID=A0A836CN99_9STRA|nr:hypothetical protein JKP88DRAFT_292123 [Tribonema minus]
MLASEAPGSDEDLLIPRAQVRDAIASYCSPNRYAGRMVLVTGGTGAGKPTVAKTAFANQKGVIYTSLRPSCAEAPFLVESWAAAVLKELGMQDQVQEWDNPLDLCPIFIIDVDARFYSSQQLKSRLLEKLLFTSKRLSTDAYLADFVIVLSAATAAAGLRSNVGDLRFWEVDIGDLNKGKAEQYIHLALAKWRAAQLSTSSVNFNLKAGVESTVLTDEEEKQLVADAIAQCGTRVDLLERLCHSQWPSCRTREELERVTVEVAATAQRDAVRAWKKFMSLLPATTSKNRAQQLAFLRRVVESSTCEVTSLDAADAFGTSWQEFVLANAQTIPVHPFIMSISAMGVQADSVLMRRAMEQQIAMWEKEH